MLTTEVKKYILYNHNETGKMAKTVRGTIQGDTLKIKVNASYAKFVYSGTGIYGVHKHPIVPLRAKYLRFKPKGSNVYLFKKSVKGQKRTEFLKKAIEQFKSKNKNLVRSLGLKIEHIQFS
jgi:hypothetical protein